MLRRKTRALKAAILWQEKRVLLLFDGSDEIAGGNPGNLYERMGLQSWPHLKMIITCRTHTSDNTNFFVPGLWPPIYSAITN